ncbi:MAG: TerB family tellurite resistance protein [Deltaproteobacteria bacterium]
MAPPVPADLAALLGAFLSRRGVTSSPVVFLIVWLANVAGALGVYLVARRYGRRVFNTGPGRRLLTPEAIGVIEREYLRFGLGGIFLARFLPGIRAVVPPFAGIVNLSPLRAGLPIALASAIWYGGVTYLGAELGANWDRISVILSGVNQTLGWIALVVVVLWLGTAWLRARRRRRERVWDVATRALGAPLPTGEHPTVNPRGAAMLVLELAYADEALTPEDRALVEEHLRERWGLEPGAGRPSAGPGRFEQYRKRLAERFSRPQRLALVEGMWHAAFSDGAIGAQEERVMGRAGELLGLSPAEIAEALRRSREGAEAGK